MVFIACGINHKTAPLKLRESIALSHAMHDSLLASLMALPDMREGMVLSTCNRTEIYCYTEASETIIPWFAKKHQIDINTLLPHIYQYEGISAVRHALKVASGMDSMMIGEPQILGQIKQAWQNARILGTAHNKLRPIFEFVFSASKRIRSHSGIGNNPVSVAYAGVQLINKHFTDLRSLSVFLAGSGETATLVAKYLHNLGIQDFYVASRTQKNAEKLATSLQGKALTITDIPSILPKADIIVSATTCPLPFINVSMVTQALKIRSQKPMFFLDLAVPRDIEPEVGLIAQVQLYNLDDLQKMTEQSLHERRHAKEKAELYLEVEMQKYQRLYQARKANTLISDYRELMYNLAEQELNRALQKLAQGHNQAAVLTEFSTRLVKKLTHLPSTGLRQVAQENQEALLQLAQYLFNTSLSRHTHEEIA